jgi:hypothetical protein
MSNGEIWVVTPELSVHGSPQEVLSKATLKPLFKYPSWKYPGEYATDAVAPQKTIRVVWNLRRSSSPCLRGVMSETCNRPATRPKTPLPPPRSSAFL